MSSQSSHQRCNARVQCWECTSECLITLLLEPELVSGIKENGSLLRSGRSAQEPGRRRQWKRRIHTVDADVVVADWCSGGSRA